MNSSYSQSPPVVHDIRHGPHQPPYIGCGNCGTEHHYDAATGEFQGRCRDCGNFLRRPREAEHEQFTEFLVWNSSFGLGGDT